MPLTLFRDKERANRKESFIRQRVKWFESVKQQPLTGDESDEFRALWEKMQRKTSDEFALQQGELWERSQRTEAANV